MRWIKQLFLPKWERPADPARQWEAWFEYRLELLERREAWLLRLLVARLVADLIIYLWQHW